MILMYRKEMIDLSKSLEKRIEKLEKQLNKPQVAGSFEKVSFDQFVKDSESLDKEYLKKVYEDILVLPVRGTEEAMGHDFVTTKDVCLKPGETARIVTGIKVKCNKGWGLWLAPRSGLGSKFRMQLDNTIGIIDGDYYNNEKNEGHIMAFITNDSKDDKVLKINAGERFLQGVFLEYGITDHDSPLGKRKGGEGSTGV